MNQRITRSMRKTRSVFHPSAATTTHAVGRKVPRKAGAIRIKQEHKPTPSTPVKSTKVAAVPGVSTHPPKSTPSMTPTTPPSILGIQGIDLSTAPDLDGFIVLLSAALVDDFGLTYVPLGVPALQSQEDKSFYQVVVFRSQNDDGLFIFCRLWTLNCSGTYELEGSYTAEQVTHALGFREYSRFRTELAQAGKIDGPKHRRCGHFELRDDRAFLYHERTVTV